MWDQLGKLVYDSSMPEGTNTKTVGTHDLAAGVYVLQMDSGTKGNFIRKKIAVVHGN